ncbi:MAG TPA: hypothetical protein VHG08_14040 [Longimicrobium sp.]|nr:hypothetical protein [Longimicrobium sp.]
MNRRLSALLIPLVLAGCATAQRGSADEAGLRARMYHNNGSGVRVALSEPAHVAIFEVVPGERVSLFYPAVESDPSHVAAGRITLHPGGRRARSYPASSYGRQAPLLYMIASRQPLDDALIRDLQEGLGSLVGDPFRSNNPAETMEYLASLVVPVDLPETEWTTDVLSRYPGGGQVAGAAGAHSNRSICRSGGSNGDYSCLTPAQQRGQRQAPAAPRGGGSANLPPRGRDN